MDEVRNRLQRDGQGRWGPADVEGTFLSHSLVRRMSSCKIDLFFLFLVTNAEQGTTFGLFREKISPEHGIYYLICSSQRHYWL